MFKSLAVFRFVDKDDNLELPNLEPTTITLDVLSRTLATKPFADCMSTQSSSVGFVPVITDKDSTDERLVIEVAPQVFMFCLQTQEKLLPSDVMRDLVDKQVKEVEQKEGHKLSNKAKTELKDNLIFSLIPTALPKNTKTHAYIDVANGWFVVDSASSSRAEKVTSVVRSCLGSLRIFPIQGQFKDGVSFKLTYWLEYPSLHTEFSSFGIGDDCQLKVIDGKDTITFKNSMGGRLEDVVKNLRNCMQITKLAMTWKHKISFVIDDKFGIKRVEFLDLVSDAINDQRESDCEGQERIEMIFSTDALIMVGEVKQLLDDLVNVFGGFKE
jgi:recombination associated protein RdgC